MSGRRRSVRSTRYRADSREVENRNSLQSPERTRATEPTLQDVPPSLEKGPLATAPRDGEGWPNHPHGLEWPAQACGIFYFGFRRVRCIAAHEHLDRMEFAIRL